MTEKISLDKQELRLQLADRIHEMSDIEKAKASLVIENYLLSFLLEYMNSLPEKTNFNFANYNPLKSEPKIDWQSLAKKLEAQTNSSIHWCFPKVKENKMIFLKEAQNFEKSKLQILEPIDGQEIDISEIEIVIAPGLGFSQSGLRLGRGKAFYDSVLSYYKGIKIGLCFSITFLSKLPREAHDIVFNQIITENLIHQVVHSEGELKWN